MPTLSQVVSGGQTGVDRAALDAALAVGLPCRGWCPRGRLAEDGAIPERYPLVETPSERYEQRTEWNVRDSDATLVLARGPLAGGTAYSVRVAEGLGKPSLVVDPADPGALDAALAWLEAHGVRALNVAGPRESGVPGIQGEATAFLRRLFTRARAAA